MKEETSAFKDILNKIEELDEEENDDVYIEKQNALIVEFTEERERLAKKIKYSSPTKQRILRIQLVDLDNKLESLKRGLKEFESLNEEEKRVKKNHEKKMDDLFAKADRHLEKIYIVAKHSAPKHFFDQLHQTIMSGLPPEEQKDFLDRIAHLEATKLSEILAGEKKTANKKKRHGANKKRR